MSIYVVVRNKPDRIEELLNEDKIPAELAGTSPEVEAPKHKVIERYKVANGAEVQVLEFKDEDHAKAVRLSRDPVNGTVYNVKDDALRMAQQRAEGQ